MVHTEAQNKRNITRAINLSSQELIIQQLNFVELFYQLEIKSNSPAEEEIVYCGGGLPWASTLGKMQ